MLAPRDNPFPFEAVRDLLGVVRALWVWARSAGRQRDQDRLSRVGNMLREASVLAVEHQPGTLGHAAAWEKAESAVEELGLVVDVLIPARPVVEAAGKRVLRRKSR